MNIFRSNEVVKFVVVLAFLVPMMIFSGCSKVNKENYEKIKVGMSYQEVINVLGKPDSCEETIVKTKSCIWGSPEKHVEIKFIADTVAWHSYKGI